MNTITRTTVKCSNSNKLVATRDLDMSLAIIPLKVISLIKTESIMVAIMITSFMGAYSNMINITIIMTY